MKYTLPSARNNEEKMEFGALQKAGMSCSHQLCSNNNNERVESDDCEKSVKQEGNGSKNESIRFIV